ncbi:unnamed protein product [Sphagnum compactum]
MCSYAFSRTSKRSKGCGASEKATSDSVKCINEMLTNHICDIIFSCLEDSRDIGRASCTCRGFNEAGKNVRSVRWVCRNEDHENARKTRAIKKPSEDDHGETSQINSECMDVNNRSHNSSLDSFGNEVQGSSPGQRTGNESRRRLDEESGAHKTQGSTDQNLGVPFGSKSDVDKPNNFKDQPVDGSEVCESSKSRQNHQHMPFREAVEQGLKSKPCIQQLRIEIEPKLQSKSVDVNERQLTDHWLSDPHHLQRWVPFVGDTLQHVCIADYGPQAMTRQSPILKIFSQNCMRLKTIDLRNMFIDTRECIEMPMLFNFTLRCVKVNNDALDHINEKMKNLQTLALLGVFGVLIGCLESPKLKVLCLGLSTKAKKVTMNLPNLSKLQLKMACPNELSIIAPELKFVAFNLEVHNCSSIEFCEIKQLQELLYGASKFFALSKLVKMNQFLNKVFLDIPCMALGEDGKWLGVLKEVTLNLPNFKILQYECPNLEILNIGPGLWHSMELNLPMVMEVKKWPPVKTLILHMIPQTLVTCVTLLEMFRMKMHDTLVNLEIYVHTTSPVDGNDFFEAIQDQVAHLSFKRKDGKMGTYGPT